MFNIFGKYSFLKFMLSGLCMLSIDGENNIGGGSDVDTGGTTGDEGDKGAGDAQPTVEQLQEKLKGFDGVDVDKYNALKDLDPDVAKQAVELFNKIKDNKELMAQVTGQQQKTLTVEEQIAALQEQINGKEAKQHYDKFMSQAETAITEAVKKLEVELISDGIDEKDFVLKNVIDVFLKDETEAQEKGLPRGKLDWKDIPRVVEEQVAKISSYRKAIMSKSLKKGAAPEINGEGTQKTKTGEEKIESGAERRESLAQGLAQAFAKV